MKKSGLILASPDGEYEVSAFYRDFQKEDILTGLKLNEKLRCWESNIYFSDEDNRKSGVLN